MQKIDAERLAGWFCAIKGTDPPENYGDRETSLAMEKALKVSGLVPNILSTYQMEVQHYISLIPDLEIMEITDMTAAIAERNRAVMECGDSAIVSLFCNGFRMGQAYYEALQQAKELESIMGTRSVGERTKAMSMATLETAILAEARAVFNNRKLRKKDILEWGTGTVKAVDGEVQATLPVLKVNVAILKVNDKRKLTT
jgi:hypothetical protein